MYRLTLFLGMCVLAMIAGCSTFPKAPAQTDASRTRCWKIRSADRFDYFQYLDENGKIVALGYDDNRDGVPEVRIDFVNLGSDSGSPHYGILLDGIPFKLVQRMYQQGHFRLFYPPTELISCFPSNTDVAYCEMFCPGTLSGYEALYYDRQTGRLSDGNKTYLSGANAPWEKYLDYRISMLLDPIGYVSPNLVFNQEMAGIERTIEQKKCGTVLAYSVGTSNVGTRKGEEGLVDCLKRIDQLCEKVVHDRRGSCRITILADHGHNLTPSNRFDVADVLKANGFRVRDKLVGSNDVVCIEFGLVTYSAMYTNDPEKVAVVLLDQEPVELAVYPVRANGEDRIVVRDKGGMAYISRIKANYRYEPVTGDPLKLDGILKRLRREGKVDSAGVIDQKALFRATVHHEYPDPLHRIWRGFHGLAKHPADLVVTVKDGWFCGSLSFARSINVASTHGSLNEANSVTFIMSTVKPLPEAMGVEDVRKAFPDFRGEK